MKTNKPEDHRASLERLLLKAELKLTRLRDQIHDVEKCKSNLLKLYKESIAQENQHEESENK